MKKKIHTYKSIKLKLATETITTGPGTVPTSNVGTSVAEMTSRLREASKIGLFDSFIKDEPSNTSGK